METGTIVVVMVCVAILAAIIGFVGAAIVRALRNNAPAAGAAAAAPVQPQGILNPNAAQWTPMDVNNAVDRGCDITHFTTGGTNYTRVRPSCVLSPQSRACGVVNTIFIDASDRARPIEGIPDEQVHRIPVPPA